MLKNAAAKTIRIFTIPPILVSVLLCAIYFLHPGVFLHTWDYPMALLCLAIIPTLAYPLQPFIPGFKGKGRSSQRSLAFIMSAIGYTVGVIYAFVSNAADEYKFILSAYFLSIILLLIFNKGFHLKASGHACGILGPLLFAVFFLGWEWAIPCAVTAAGVAWSSVTLSRHTPRELLLGGLCALVSFAVTGIYIL